MSVLWSRRGFGRREIPMSKLASARHVAIREGDTVEIDFNERVVSAEYDSPYIYLIILKEEDHWGNR